MTIEMDHAGDLTVLKVDGDLAGDNAVQLRALAQQALSRGRLDFCVDLAGANGCDSTGLEALTWLQRECQERLGLVHLAAPSPTFEKVLELTRLRDLFQHGSPAESTDRGDHGG